MGITSNVSWGVCAHRVLVKTFMGAAQNTKRIRTRHATLTGCTARNVGRKNKNKSVWFERRNYSMIYYKERSTSKAFLDGGHGCCIKAKLFPPPRDSLPAWHRPGKIKHRNYLVSQQPINKATAIRAITRLSAGVNRGSGMPNVGGA